jgi:hypothetical protein
MLQNLGSMAKRFLARTSAFASLRARQRLAKTTRAALNKLASAEYNSIFRGNSISAPMTNVITAVQGYGDSRMYGWRRQPMIHRMDGSVGPIDFILDCQENYLLGQLGCPVTINSAGLGIHVSFLANNGRTEAMVVPYRFIFKVELSQMGNVVYVSASLDEQIDPMNSNKYIRNGHASAPSLLGVRTGDVSKRSLVAYLHGASGESLPDYKTWFDGPGQLTPHLAKALEEMYQAERDLMEAEEQSKKLGWRG